MSEAQNAPMIFAEPTPMGLIGLAIGCAALAPIALRLTLTPAACSGSPARSLKPPRRRPGKPLSRARSYTRRA